MKKLNWIEQKTETPDDHKVFVAKTPVGEYRVIYTGINGWWWVKYCNESNCEGDEHDAESAEQAKLLAQNDFDSIRSALCA